jgi:hypothetical protein
MSPMSCTEVEKLLLISSLQSLDSIRDELRAGVVGQFDVEAALRRHLAR